MSNRSQTSEREGADLVPSPADYLAPGEHAWAELYLGSVLDD